MTLLLLHARTLPREEAGAENTWQEDMDMPDASPTPSALVDVASHVVSDLLTLSLLRAATPTRTCRRVCSTESRGMRPTVLRSTRSTSI